MRPRSDRASSSAPPRLADLGQRGVELGGAAAGLEIRELSLGLGEARGGLVAGGALGVAVLGEEDGAGVHRLTTLDGEPGEGPGGERSDAGLVSLGPAVEDALDAAASGEGERGGDGEQELHD